MLQRLFPIISAICLLLTTQIAFADPGGAATAAKPKNGLDFAVITAPAKIRVFDSVTLPDWVENAR